MVQLKISTAKMADDRRVVRRFPFHIGRSPAADLTIEEAGIWDQHLLLDFDPAQGFVLSTQPNAIASVNGWPIQAVILRNGDIIEIGAAKIYFWIGETRQSNLLKQENVVWATILLATLAQITLIGWLLK